MLGIPRHLSTQIDGSEKLGARAETSGLTFIIRSWTSYMLDTPTRTSGTVRTESHKSPPERSRGNPLVSSVHMDEKARWGLRGPPVPTLVSILNIPVPGSAPRVPSPGCARPLDPQDTPLQLDAPGEHLTCTYTFPRERARNPAHTIMTGVYTRNWRSHWRCQTTLRHVSSVPTHWDAHTSAHACPMGVVLASLGPASAVQAPTGPPL
eukprot:4976322-Prymnesium_polylepis.1